MGNVRYKGDNYTRSNLSSGSNVVPNPEGEATETLNKIGIDETIYDFPKELPTVTSEDAGDVLTVNNNGEWAKAAPSGGDAVFIKATRTQTGTFSIPYTGAQFKELCENKVVYVIVRYNPNKPDWAEVYGNPYLNTDTGSIYLSTTALINTNPPTIRYGWIEFTLGSGDSQVVGTRTTHNIVSAQ